MEVCDQPLMGKLLDDPLLERIRPFLEFLARYHRYRVYGLERIPKNGRVLLVVNHSFATYDGILLGAAVIVQTGRMPVALADSNFFKWDWVGRFATRIGMVEANHEAAEKALAEGHLVTVAPGGMREALRPQNQRYSVLWHKRKGFVRLALRTQTPIVLAACPQADELYDVYPNAITKWMYKNLKLPFVFLKGWGPTLIPKPIRLAHFLSKPLLPPAWKDGDPGFDEKTEEFHSRVLDAMSDLMACARELSCEAKEP